MTVDNGLRPIFRQNLRDFDWQSIESHLTGSGTPDSNYCLMGTEGWVEYKATDAWSVSFRPGQVGWFLRRRAHGGRCHIAVRRQTKAGPRKGKAVDELWIVHGDHVVELRDKGLRGIRPMLVSSGGPTRWDWQTVRGILLGPPDYRE